MCECALTVSVAQILHSKEEGRRRARELIQETTCKEMPVNNDSDGAVAGVKSLSARLIDRGAAENGGNIVNLYKRRMRRLSELP